MKKFTDFISNEQVQESLIVAIIMAAIVTVSLLFV